MCDLVVISSSGSLSHLKVGMVHNDYMEEGPPGLAPQRGDAADGLRLDTVHATPVEQDSTWVLDRH